MRKRRRTPNLHERLTPCICCGYPLSQRHHLVSIAAVGEHEATVQLCANCHELFHLLEAFFGDRLEQPTERIDRLLGAFVARFGRDDERLRRLMSLVGKATYLAHEVGL